MVNAKIQAMLLRTYRNRCVQGQWHQTSITLIGMVVFLSVASSSFAHRGHGHEFQNQAQPTTAAITVDMATARRMKLKVCLSVARCWQWASKPLGKLKRAPIAR